MAYEIFLGKVQLPIPPSKLSIKIKCVHTFSENEHWMDLTLRGGEFVG